MKKNKHITINIDEGVYNDIVSLAEGERRKVAEYIYLIVIDEIKRRIINKYKDYSSGFHRLKLNSDDE